MSMSDTMSLNKPSKDGPSLSAAVPILYVRDLEQALQYYRSILGFEVGWTFGNPPELASVCRDRVEFNLSKAGEHEFQLSRVYVYVDDVDIYYNLIIAAGARATYPLEDRFYGMRDCRIEDPDGNQISFGTPLEG
jgi:catechol 2,3-dioxygenase-like lactoylglutathione lyase family enzyme